MRDTTFVFDSPLDTVEGYQWKAKGGYRAQSSISIRLLGAGCAIQSTVGDLFRFQQALHSNNLMSKKSQLQIFSSRAPYSWKINRIRIESNLFAKVHSYDG